MWIAKLLYLLLIGVVYLFSILYLPEFSVYLLITMLVIPIGFFAAAHITGKKLTVQITAPSVPVHPGASCVCTLLLRNATRLPVGTVRLQLLAENIVLLDGVMQEFQTAVPAGGTAQLSVSIVPEHCGKIQLTVTKLRVFDFIHLFSHQKTVNDTDTFLVLPAVPEPTETELKFFEENAVQMQPTMEPEEFLGVREYRNGDRMRSIHWKLSSRFPEPVVREYGIPVKTPVVVGLLYALQPQLPDAGNRLDAMLEATMAFAKLFCCSGYAMTLIVCRSDWRQSHIISAPEDLTPLLRTLLESSPDTDPDTCWTTLGKTGDIVSFCIADHISGTVSNATVLVADASSAGINQSIIVPHKAAETVYQLLTDF